MVALVRKLASPSKVIPFIVLWWSSMVERTVARFVGWVFSLHTVQEAIEKQVRCGTPLGTALTGHIENVIEENAPNVESEISDWFSCNSIHVDDVEGLDDTISDTVREEVRDHLDDISVDAENVDNLDDAIAQRIDALIDDCTPQLVALVAQRMAY